MKFFCLLFIFILLIQHKSSGQVTGRGCDFGDRVATVYLGTTTYYGSTKIVEAYKADVWLQVIRGNGYSGYKCGFINIYPSGSKWNGSQDVPYDGVNEITSRESDPKGCVLQTTYKSNHTIGEGEGSIVSYRYNDPKYFSNSDPSSSCPSATPPSNLPVDDYLPITLLVFGGLGFTSFSKRNFLNLKKVS
ncbi:hypothetical protein [Pedobacter agri]|uniref:Uncharacterized protein n=1 Tax=Pedobacter agri TaxID=454586 RepID=A0A9X3I846_9SPHI|nr:hypothetical protein [Pedobacter agri]MCX3263624.1 hypothetical protein [Pedobacter agri]